MKNLILSCIIYVFLLAGCKDKDITVNIYNNCGSSTSHTNTDFTLYIPNTYSPNSDKLNDLFRIYVFDDTSQNVKSVTNIVIKNSLGDKVFSRDTMTVLNGQRVDWDFTDQNGDLVLGSMTVTLTVTTLSGKQHQAEYRICSYTCESLKANNVELDFTKCRFEDQLDPTRGFVLQTSEPKPSC